MKLTEQEQKERDEIQDRFLLVQVLSLVRDYLQDKREKEKQQTEQTAPVKPKAESKKEKSSEV
jgi:hypothetical protein